MIDPTAAQLAALFNAMADPTRAHLLLLLLSGEKRSGELASALGNVSHSAVSHQLRWLRDHQIVAGRKEGREVFYELADACIVEIMQVALRHITEDQA